MKRLFLLSALLLFLFACQKNNHTMKLVYPQPKKVDSSTNFFGTVVKDPYRWMENENDPD